MNFKYIVAVSCTFLSIISFSAEDPRIAKLKQIMTTEKLHSAILVSRWTDTHKAYISDLAQKVDINAYSGGITVLMTVMQQQSFDDIMQVLDLPGIDVTKKSQHGFLTALHYLLMRPSNATLTYQQMTQIIRKLKNRGADINAADKIGDTPLMHALARNADASHILGLLLAGASPNIINHNGEDAIYGIINTINLAVFAKDIAYSKPIAALNIVKTLEYLLEAGICIQPSIFKIIYELQNEYMEDSQSNKYNARHTFLIMFSLLCIIKNMITKYLENNQRRPALVHQAFADFAQPNANGQPAENQINVPTSVVDIIVQYAQNWTPPRIVLEPQPQIQTAFVPAAAAASTMIRLHSP